LAVTRPGSIQLARTRLLARLATKSCRCYAAGTASTRGFFATDMCVVAATPDAGVGIVTSQKKIR
jgi:hypothetical protein